jgi:hypothetical protein
MSMSEVDARHNPRRHFLCREYRMVLTVSEWSSTTRPWWPTPGLILVATSAARLGLAGLVDATVRLGRCRFAPGRKVLTIVHAMVAGGSHIDHTDILAAGATGKVLGHRVMAPRRSGRSCAPSPSAMSANWMP